MSLTYEMEYGIEFAFESMTQTITESYSYGIEQDTTRNYSADITVEHTVSCTERGDRVGVGLWQWVTANHEGKNKVFSNNTVCRYGTGVYNTSPKCPWNACADSMCETCISGWNA